MRQIFLEREGAGGGNGFGALVKVLMDGLRLLAEVGKKWGAFFKF